MPSALREHERAEVKATAERLLGEEGSDLVVNVDRVAGWHDCRDRGDVVQCAAAGSAPLTADDG